MPVTTADKILVKEYLSIKYPLVKQARYFVFFLALALASSRAFAGILMYGEVRTPAQAWSVSGVGVHNGGGFSNGSDNLVGFFDDSSDQIVFDATAPFQAFSSVSHTNLGGNSGSASGSAAIGLLNSTAIHRDPFSTQVGSRSMNDVAWYDCATINSPGLAGQIGIMNVQLDVRGFLEADAAFPPIGAQYAGADLWFTRLASASGINEQFQFDRNWRVRSDDLHKSRSINESLQFGVAFRFGSEFEFFMRGLTQASPTQNPRPAGESSAELSIQWSGIQSITHNGNKVDFSITSKSGFDYINPDPGPATVPEPSTLMFIVLTAAVACFKRPLRRLMMPRSCLSA